MAQPLEWRERHTGQPRGYEHQSHETMAAAGDHNRSPRGALPVGPCRLQPEVYSLGRRVWKGSQESRPATNSNRKQGQAKVGPWRRRRCCPSALGKPFWVFTLFLRSVKHLGWNSS